MNAPENELHSLIEDSAQRLFADHVSRALLERFEQGGFCSELWQLCGEAGFAATPVPERNGGVGGSWRDAWPVLTAIGQWSVPVPIAETMVGNSLLAFAGIALPPDNATLTLIEASDRLNFSGEASDDGHASVSGQASQVPWGRHCRHAVIVAGAEPGRSGLRIALVDLAQTDAVTFTQVHNMAHEPRDTLEFTSARCRMAEVPGGIGLARPVLQLGALARAAMISGALQQVLKMSVQYANDRVQFGKPIGKNQAIQQQLAVLAGEAGAAQIAARVAIESWSALAAGIHDGGKVDDTAAASVGFDIAVAKCRASQAAGVATSIVHQTHGAIGFTYEHMLHFSTRRLWSWRSDYGSASWWAQRLGRAAVTAGKDGFWPALTARALPVL